MTIFTFWLTQRRRAALEEKSPAVEPRLVIAAKTENDDLKMPGRAEKPASFSGRNREDKFAAGLDRTLGSNHKTPANKWN